MSMAAVSASAYEQSIEQIWQSQDAEVRNLMIDTLEDF
jgi:hypothetical protein